MARPKKCTVDYFPHYITSNSRTIFILEQKYGNNGYALWFKLLELLGSTDGHYLDFNDETDFEFFAAKAKIETEKAIEIIDQLAKLKAIDRELWKHKIIWCQKFVDNLSDLYTRRRVSLPKKPTLEEITNDEEHYIESMENEGSEIVSDDKTTSFQIVKEVYEQNIGMLSGTVVEIINYYIEQGMQAELIAESIKKSCMNNKRTMSYAEGILKNWLKEGIRTIEQYNASVVERESNKGITKDCRYTDDDLPC